MYPKHSSSVIARPCPSGHRLLQFDHVRVEIHEIRIFQETIVNPFKIPLDASLSQFMGSLFFSLPTSMAMRSLPLNDIILN